VTAAIVPDDLDLHDRHPGVWPLDAQKYGNSDRQRDDRQH
jgi:hypothetical protein